MTPLTGKIFWVNDDFKFIGEYLQDEDTIHASAKIHHALVDDHTIQFYTEKMSMLMNIV